MAGGAGPQEAGEALSHPVPTGSRPSLGKVSAISLRHTLEEGAAHSDSKPLGPTCQLPPLAGPCGCGDAEPFTGPCRDPEITGPPGYPVLHLCPGPAPDLPLS